MEKNYISPNKNELTQINVSDIDFPLPDLKNITEPKTAVIAKWIVKWIEDGLNTGKIKFNYVLPHKPDLAYLLGVSIGTIQTAYRRVEDLGYLESKQCLGTIVKDPKDKKTALRKLTSKREMAIEKIKQYIKANNMKKGDKLTSARAIGNTIGYSANTARLAIDYLCSIGILKRNYQKNEKISCWEVVSTDFEIVDSEMVTLVEKIENDLKNYIVENLKVGDRMPSHSELSKILKASIKTVHDGLQILVYDGIILPRRGRYGTTVIKMPNDNSYDEQKETSIFAPAPEAAFYYYEKTQNYIKKLIADEYEIGDKLPSIFELAEKLNLSPNTIRKAFSNLAKEGYLIFNRGRYGGTFVVSKPEVETQSFKWLAVNPQYTKAYK